MTKSKKAILKQILKRSLILQVTFSLIILTTVIDIVSSDDFYTLDHTFAYHDVKDCKNNEYYDVHHFDCKRCETGYNLVPSKDSK